ncbi:transposase [Streptomyces clavifer]|uniref:transposase n=1 Tax=Streptomyces clavifer TaxID=68188 RepID=UPI000A6C8691
MDHGVVVRRHEPCDDEWEFRTGVAWRDVPDRYGPWTTPHTRFRRWAADGTFEGLRRAAQAKADAAGDIEWLVPGRFHDRPGPPVCGGARKEGSATRPSAGPEAA